MNKKDKILKAIESKLQEQKHKISRLPDVDDMYELGTLKGMREIYRLVKSLDNGGSKGK